MLTKALIHKSITEDRVVEMYEQSLTSLDNPGICLICGSEADGCEPDAERYGCEACGADAVMGIESIMLRYFG